ncbi:MAG: MmcQ/YjbR family DNA-binding protein [Stackebrandtia sp.]
MALPEATEVGTGDDRTFSVKGKTFATGHCAGDRESVWFKVSGTTRQRLLERDGGRRFFTPRYVGRHGWLGAWLDDRCDWSEIADLLRESYRMTAPKSSADAVSTPESVRSLTALPAMRSCPFRALTAGRAE